MADDEHSDEGLLKRLGEGDLEALGCLFDHYHERLVRYVPRAFPLDIHAAEDIVMGAFEKLLQKDLLRRVSAMGGPDFGPYLYAMVRNAAISYLRHENSMQVRGRKQGQPKDTGQRPDTDLELTEEQAKQRQEISDCLGGLPRHYQEALVLKYMEGLPSKKVAAITGADPNVVAGWLARGKGRMAKCLEEKGYPGKLGDMQVLSTEKFR